MKLYCYHTPSHDVLFENYFLPSLKDEFEIVRVRDSTQWCSTAVFRRPGWRETQCRKIRIWLEALRDSEIFIGSDVDIQWFDMTEGALLDALADNDLAVQTYLGGGICSGFFICRSNDATIRLWTSVLTDLEKGLARGEQPLLRERLYRNEVQWTELPISKFWSPSANYTQVTEIDVPTGILMHHATFTIGVNAKIEQLEYVRRCRRSNLTA